MYRPETGQPADKSRRTWVNIILTCLVLLCIAFSAYALVFGIFEWHAHVMLIALNLGLVLMAAEMWRCNRDLAVEVFNATPPPSGTMRLKGYVDRVWVTDFISSTCPLGHPELINEWMGNRYGPRQCHKCGRTFKVPPLAKAKFIGTVRLARK